MSILDSNQCDSVRTIARITKAIYVMESDVHSALYRVGCIGANGNNNAIRRLAQCAQWNEQRNCHVGWRYMLLKTLDQRSREACREAEQCLRAGTVLSSGAFATTRVGRSDSFTCHNRNKVLEVVRALFDA